MAKKSKSKSNPAVTTRPPIQIPLDEFSIEHYGRYGRAVLEDRAIPDYRDGMTPVNRRLLWSAYTLGIRSDSKFVKAARLVGDVLGRFHPHGDSSAYGAMVKMTNVGHVTNNIIHALFEGEGNWGNLSSRAPAAMRYTEFRLSKFSDRVLFDKFYTPVIETVPNFDSSAVEPLVIPALLPVLFLNGAFGIAPGATANIPSFEIKSVIRVLDAAYRGEEITSKFLFKTLRVVSTFGGHEPEPKADDEQRRELFTKKRGAVVLKSTISYDKQTRKLTVTAFANANLTGIIEKVSTYVGVQTVQDLSDTKDRYGKIVVQFKKLTPDEEKKLVHKITDYLSAKENYVLNFTRRFKDETGQGQATMKALTLVQAFTSWISWRTKLEQRACEYWIGEDRKEIRRLELLVQASDLIDTIVKLLKAKGLSAQEVFERYAKIAKITIDEAKYVLNRPIISLRNLERPELQARIKVVTVNMKSLERRRDKPKPFMAEQLKNFKEFM